MSRPTTWPPRLIRKPGSAEARTFFSGRWWTCGKWDTRANRPSPEAKARHLEYVQVWASDPDADPRGESLLSDVLTDWLASPDAPVHKSDRSWVPKIIRRLVAFRPRATAESFDAAALAAFQAWLCELREETESLEAGDPIYNRTSIKRHIVGKILRAMTWAAREGRYSVSWEQVHGLKAVPGPKPSRVRESNIVLPCERADLDRVIAAAHPQLAAVLDILWWTGARPSELLGLRSCDVQRSGTLTIPKVTPIPLGDVWAAQVKSKVSRLGHVRCLVFGPRAQAILGPILDGRKPDEFLFSPRRSVEKPGNRRTRKLGERYDANALAHATRYARKRAFAVEGDAAPAVTPYSIRHACSSRVVAAMGAEAEQAYLGHGGSRITQRYAGWNSTLAAKVALALG